ncbi:MAG: arginine--tRNA ligase [bacterium]|nr:arginine--tRNA ligase [bacterium]
MKLLIKKVLKEITKEEIFQVEVPIREDFGHYSTNLALKLGKEKGESPMLLAQELAAKIKASPSGQIFDRVEAAEPGFVNFWLGEDFLRESFNNVYRARKSYGESQIGKGRKVIVEFSSPNIAKPMHVGHLRTTIIGDALANICEFLGYKVIRWNYIGDWGTQFGKLLAAYKLWGDEKKVKTNPIGELLRLYIKFSKDEKENPELQGKGQEEFRKLEAGDRENRKTWEWIKKESLREFEKVYSVLGIRFDEVVGESFFQSELNKLIDDLLKNKLAEVSEGAVILRLDQFGLSTTLLRKSDGGSLYLTRELANLKYRLKKFKPDKILYVVANQQSLHFEQLFAAAKLLGLDKAELFHVKFGLTLGEDGKKFATRDGYLIPLSDVISKVVELSYNVVSQKNPDLPEAEKRRVAEVVGIGSLKYYDLKENRLSDIVFDWERMLDLKGNSAPYLLYAYARLSGIIKKAPAGGSANYNNLEGDLDFALIRKILQFPDIVAEAAETMFTSNLANYLYELASLANRFYEEVPILKDENELRRNARLSLIDMVRVVLEKGLKLLGIEVLTNI